MTIQPYTEEFVPSVAEFNRRVTMAEAPFQLPETPVPAWLPKFCGRNLYQELFLAVERDQVRGGYKLKHQDFSFRGRVLSIGYYQNPISEGIVDNRYILVGVKLLHDALRRQPLLYDLGIGSPDAAVARMHQAMGWRLRVVPFFFKVRNGLQFLRNIQYLRTTRLRRLLLDAAAYSGLGWIAAKIAGTVMSARNRELKSVSSEEVSAFSTWADEIWEACWTEYSMAAVRDADVLNILYPLRDPRFIRLRIRDGAQTIGWAVLLNSRMSNDKYFGNMRVGSIVDCLAAPECAPAVIFAAARELERRGADLLISNQSHPAWRGALRRAGFLSASSNFIFAASEKLTELLDEIDPSWSGIHLTRGDGDGPIHL